MGTTIKHSVPDRVKQSFVIFDIRALRRCPERQSARMSKITNDGLTRSGTRCFLTTVGVKGLKIILYECYPTFMLTFSAGSSKFPSCSHSVTKPKPGSPSYTSLLAAR